MDIMEENKGRPRWSVSVSTADTAALLHQQSNYKTNQTNFYIVEEEACNQLLDAIFVK